MMGHERDDDEVDEGDAKVTHTEGVGEVGAGSLGEGGRGLYCLLLLLLGKGLRPVLLLLLITTSTIITTTTISNYYCYRSLETRRL